jgi:hypothetical protein
MGLTPYLKLPYPELTSQANVPVDTKKLADAVEAVLGGLLPAPVGRFLGTMQPITSTDAVNEQAINPVATLRNPHGTLFLLVNVRASGWVDPEASGTTGGIFYGQVKNSGVVASYDTSAIRQEKGYQDVAAELIATIAPGVTGTFQLMGHKSASNKTVNINYTRTVITPIGWLKTGAIA